MPVLHNSLKDVSLSHNKICSYEVRLEMQQIIPKLDKSGRTEHRGAMKAQADSLDLKLMPQPTLHIKVLFYSIIRFNLGLKNNSCGCNISAEPSESPLHGLKNAGKRQTHKPHSYHV